MPGAGGWAHIELHLAGVTDKPAFMDPVPVPSACRSTFGRDREAFADCFTDLSWSPPRGGRLVEITGRREYAGAEPNDWNIAREVFTDAADHWSGTGTELRIVLPLGGSS